MAKSLLLLTLVVAQFLTGSGGAVYLCTDCGTLFQAAETPPACSCCRAENAAPSNVDVVGWTKSDSHSSIPLLAPQSPSRLRDGEFALRFEHAFSAPLHLSVAELGDGSGLSQQREIFMSAAGASQLAALATVRARC